MSKATASFFICLLNQGVGTNQQVPGGGDSPMTSPVNKEVVDQHNVSGVVVVYGSVSLSVGVSGQSGVPGLG